MRPPQPDINFPGEFILNQYIVSHANAEIGRERVCQPHVALVEVYAIIIVVRIKEGVAKGN